MLSLVARGGGGGAGERGRLGEGRVGSAAQLASEERVGPQPVLRQDHARG